MNLTPEQLSTLSPKELETLLLLEELEALSKAKENLPKSNIHLEEVGSNKVSVIKSLRMLTEMEMSLTDAKNLVDRAPTVVLTVPTEEAEKAKIELEAAGAKVSIKSV
ncbi:MAG: ribosomal protein L7/L12 [Gammaproteobacteria bacterium]|jgi:ribosomal protein L7/L12|uniref:Ribosomal protein L7/L12 n=1 Tax=Pseudomonas mandelii TaxID=75612 RepID=A0AB36CWZ9_9PSED|nr:ribosomal protein L7/L12 [Pseudomonas mandelii]MBA4361582.1 ribosomal protein L7/L12 [Pseudomonas sp.]MBU0521444.1 ribosomal protein L7/L12 [Gammaproteobacteria bacterium]MBU0822379.1 ribosomal protein L7/L12 [Gammaproteobacteria bacterium]MBU0841006.1 ribosomal protein L7/L12 [Gammaproteobacteria bacterium]MBU1841875.1 ribosomal protein L7/L12 [Gammaproteobacteria bacterium]